MKKYFSAAAALIFIAAAAGCSADGSAANTQQSAYSPEVQTAAAVSSEAVQTEERFTAESAPAASEEAGAAAETAETADPVQLAHGFSNHELGLPDEQKVYIFRDNGCRGEIEGAECFGVSCYDEEDSQLTLLMELWITSDGSRAYRWTDTDGSSYKLLPEQPAFSGFEPNQPASDVMGQAAELYSAVYGELEYDAGGVRISTVRGDYYSVSDDRLDTAEKLASALEKYFAGDLLERLLSGSDGVISDEEGRLYCLEHSGGDVAFIGTEYALTSLSEDTAIYTVTSRFEYEAGQITEKKQTCTAVLTDSGWRFLTFSIPE